MPMSRTRHSAQVVASATASSGDFVGRRTRALHRHFLGSQPQGRGTIKMIGERGLARCGCFDRLAGYARQALPVRIGYCLDKRVTPLLRHVAR